MTPLFAMPGPELPDADAAIAAAGASLPELPALSGMLQRARRLPDAPDWRTGVLAHLAPAHARMPPAAVAAQAVAGLAEGAAVCLAVPVHLVPGISRVHLPHGGLLQLRAEEREAWRAAFNGEFGADGIQLHAAGGGWVLTAPFATAARDPAPEQLLGRPLVRAVAADANERALRRLGSEVEMWLAAHPLNASVSASQKLPVNSLWFWGGGTVGSRPVRVGAAAAIACAGEADAWTAGLGGLSGVNVQQADGWHAASGIQCAVLSTAGEGGNPRYWEALEARWFRPARDALKSGELGGLRLQIGTTAWQLPSRLPRRWWRAGRGWWQLVNP